MSHDVRLFVLMERSRIEYRLISDRATGGGEGARREE